MGAKNSNDAISNQNTRRIEALQKYVTSAKTEIPVGGAVLKPADVIAVFQDDTDNRKEVTATRAAYGAAVATRDASELKRQVTDEALKGWVLNRFGETSTEAKEFGYAPRKRATVTAEKRANAVKLNLATREARGTVGKKQKLAIKGSLDTATAPAVATPAATTAVPTTVTAPAAVPAATAATLNGSAHS
jgi:hypothetical protein